MVSSVSRVWKPDETLALVFEIVRRMDKFFVSKDLFTSDSQCEISPCLLSDHDFVYFVFQIPDAVRRGPGVWKFHNSLLDDKNFCEEIRNLIQSHVDC